MSEHVRLFLIIFLALDGAGGSKAEGDLMLNKFSTFSTDHVALQGDFTTFYAYVNAFENKSSALKTCSIFRTDMMIFSNTVCFKSIRKNILLII